MSDTPVPAYQDPDIVPPKDDIQHLKQTDRMTADMRAHITAILWASRDDMRQDVALGLADDLLRDVGWFRLRQDEIEGVISLERRVSDLELGLK